MAPHYTGQDGWITDRQLHYKYNDNRMCSLIEKATRRSIHLRALYEMKVDYDMAWHDGWYINSIDFTSAVTFINLVGHLNTRVWVY